MTPYENTIKLNQYYQIRSSTFTVHVKSPTTILIAKLNDDDTVFLNLYFVSVFSSLGTSVHILGLAIEIVFFPKFVRTLGMKQFDISECLVQ